MSAGKICYDSMGEEEFEWFSIHTLQEWFCQDCHPALKRSFLLNYCFAMSILGNDFLPTSLSLKIRDDGHAELLDLLKQMVQTNINIIDPTSLEICYDGIYYLFMNLANKEEERLTKYISKKMGMSYRTISSLEESPNIGHNDWPLFHVEESILINSHKKLIDNWDAIYLTHFFPGCHVVDTPESIIKYNSVDIHPICQKYLYGIQWIWAYYTGKLEDVCFDWYYPYYLPPLWKCILQYLIGEKSLPEFPNRVLIRSSDIRPVEQLALVLPLSSWSLLPSGPEKKLPYLAPHLFPESFGFETVGKRYFWECESMIPIPSIHTLKEIIKKYA
jgi:5'-3' exonuclease